MTAQRKPAESTGSFQPKAKGAGALRRSREDHQDRDTLEKARAALDAGELETISNAELKASLGLD